jgi:hypothetical protein
MAVIYKSMKSFQEFERMFESSADDVFHVSPGEIRSLDSRPMFFAISRHDSDGWFQNLLDDGREAWQFGGRFSGRGVRIDDPEIVQMLDDVDETLALLLSNPDAEDILGDPGLQRVMKAADAILIPDYNPWNFDEESDSLLVFDPQKSIREFKVIRHES